MTDVLFGKDIAPLMIMSPYEREMVKRYLAGGLETVSVKKVREQAKYYLGRLKEEIELLKALTDEK